MELSIIVSFDNRYELISNFLEHILRNYKFMDSEIILISDGCRDLKTLQYVKEMKKNIPYLKLLELKNKVGYSKANNIAVKESLGKYLLFINTDVFPQKGSIEKLLDYLQTHPKCGAVQGLLLYPQNYTVQSTGHVFSNFVNHHLYNGRQQNEKCVQKSDYRQALTTAFCMIRKDAFLNAGGFNEFYYNAYDGMELTLRIQSSELYCYYYSEAKAYHSTGGTRQYISYNDEYQGKYFFTENLKNLKSDLQNYLKMQLSEIEIANYYNVIVCTFMKNWEDLLKNLNLNYMSYFEIEDKSSPSIDLYQNLEYSFLLDAAPLLFLVDNFSNLIKNKNWFDVRNNKDDLIIDYHGNLIKPVEVFK